MWRPPERHRRPPGYGPGTAAKLSPAAKPNPASDSSPPFDWQVLPAGVAATDLHSLRQMWWNLAALGHRLPPERDVILINGGKP